MVCLKTNEEGYLGEKLFGSKVTLLQKENIGIFAIVHPPLVVRIFTRQPKVYFKPDLPSAGWYNIGDLDVFEGEAFWELETPLAVMAYLRKNINDLSSRMVKFSSP